MAETLRLPNAFLFPEVARLLEEGCTVTLPAKGDSMFPFVAGGRDEVVLRKAATVRTGDIVLAEVPGKGYVLHRVYRIAGGQLTLMGDGNLRATEACRPEAVCGTAVRLIRRGHAVDCRATGERLKAWLWRRALPLRRGLLAICRRLLKQSKEQQA